MTIAEIRHSDKPMLLPADVAEVLQMDAQALPCLLQGPDHGGGQHLHALLFQNLRQVLAQLPVQLGQQIVLYK